MFISSLTGCLVSAIYLSMPDATVANNKNLDVSGTRTQNFSKYVSVKENNPALFPNNFLVKFPKIVRQYFLTYVDNFSPTFSVKFPNYFLQCGPPNDCRFMRNHYGASTSCLSITALINYTKSLKY